MEFYKFKAHIPHEKDEDAPPICGVTTPLGRCAYAAVCDGLGGAGSSKVRKINYGTGFDTGAAAEADYTEGYLGSRWLIDAVENYLAHQSENGKFEFAEDDLKKLIRKTIEQNLTQYRPKAISPIFPSTLASVFAKMEGDELEIDTLWAGDSRVYILDEHGLHQISKDDCLGKFDPFLGSKDSGMSNKVIYNGAYTINHLRYEHVKAPLIAFACSDGCYEYENEGDLFTFANFIIDCFKKSSSTAGIDSNLLYDALKSHTAFDDRTISGFFFGNAEDLPSFFESLEHFQERLKEGRREIENYNVRVSNWNHSEGDKFFAANKQKEQVRKRTYADIQNFLERNFVSVQAVQYDPFLSLIAKWNEEDKNRLQGDEKSRVLLHVLEEYEAKKAEIQRGIEQENFNLQNLQNEKMKLSNASFTTRTVFQLCYEFMSFFNFGYCIRFGIKLDGISKTINMYEKFKNRKYEYPWDKFKDIAHDVTQAGKDERKRIANIQKTLTNLKSDTNIASLHIQGSYMDRQFAADISKILQKATAIQNEVNRCNEGRENLSELFKMYFDVGCYRSGKEKFVDVDSIYDEYVWNELSNKAIDYAEYCLRILEPKLDPRMNNDYGDLYNFIQQHEQSFRSNEVKVREVSRQINECLMKKQNLEEAFRSFPSVQHVISDAVQRSELAYFLISWFEKVLDPLSKKFDPEIPLGGCSREEIRAKFESFGGYAMDYLKKIEECSNYYKNKMEMDDGILTYILINFRTDYEWFSNKGVK